MNEIELRSYLKSKALEEGIAFNPNERIVDAIIKGLMNNKAKNGDYYCPCRKVTGDKLEDKKIICPCIYHLDEIARDGHCHCMLFVKRGD